MRAALSNRTVGVLGSGHEPHESLAASVGQLLATLEVNLLTGGGGGVMEAVSGHQGTDSLSRNHINVLSSAAIVALPGGPGTASEVSLAVRYRKPIVVFSPDEVLVEHFSKGVPRAETLEDVARFLKRHLPDDRIPHHGP